MKKIWIQELWRFGAIVGSVTLVGVFLGRAGLFFTLGLMLYIVDQVAQLARYVRWFESGKHAHPPSMSGVWGALIDITYRQFQKSRKRKKRIQRLLKNFNQFSAALPDATVILGAKQEVTWSNEMAELYLGVHQRKAIGKTITEIIDLPEFKAYLESGDYREALSITSPVNEARQLHLRIARYGTKKKVLSAHDMTRMHRLEAMRKDFVGNVSHELRTPLTVIQGYSEMLLDDRGLTEQHRQMLSQVAEQSQRMQRLVDDLLTLNRLETTEPERRWFQAVDVGLMMQRMRNEARLHPGAKALEYALEVQSEQGLFAHPDELFSAFMNLVTNATKYTPPGGKITLRWFVDKHGRGHFQVEDTGEGIPAEHLPRLSERFYRVDTGRSREKGGTGLGLAIVKHVLTRHDARLKISSEVGKGSVFSCDFPRSTVVELVPKLVVDELNPATK